jgi:hypothetical protein
MLEKAFKAIKPILDFVKSMMKVLGGNALKFLKFLGALASPAWLSVLLPAAVAGALLYLAEERNNRIDEINKNPNDPKFKDLSVYTLDIDFYVYFMNLKAVNKIWPGAVIFKPEVLNKFSVQNIKDGKNNYHKIPDAGWHFSWLGGYKKIREKALSCIEPYDKSKIPSEEDFKNYFTEYLENPSKKFIHIEDLNMQGIDLQLNLDYSNYPKYLLDNFEKFKDYFYQNDK